MPALLPPSMQIGVLPPGYMALPSAGPGAGFASPPSYPTFYQSAGAVTSSSGPTNISQTVTATKAGTTLVWMVAVNASAGAALGGTPTGWSLASSQAVATLAFGIYLYQPNPGGITTVTFSSNATATTGGIAAWFWEIPNTAFPLQAVISANGSSTAPSSGALTPKTSADILLGGVGWVLGTATFANSSTGGIAWATNAQQSSTAGTTNAAIQTLSTATSVGGLGAVTVSGTLSVSSVWVAGLLLIPTVGGTTFLDSPSRAIVLDGGAGYGAGDAGAAGWALGNTKPGGAGGGQ